MPRLEAELGPTAESLDTRNLLSQNVLTTRVLASMIAV